MKTIVDNSVLEIVLYYKGLMLGVMIDDDDALLIALPFIYFRIRKGSFRWSNIGKFTLGVFIGAMVAFILVVCLIQMYYQITPQK